MMRRGFLFRAFVTLREIPGILEDQGNRGETRLTVYLCQRK